MTTNQTFGYTPTPQNTHARAGKLNAHTVHALHTWAHENACVVTLVHPHAHACTSGHFIRSKQSDIKNLTLMVRCCW